MGFRPSIVGCSLLLAGNLGCLIIPYKPASSVPVESAVKAMGHATETRESLRAKLGQPNVLDLPSVNVWDWEGDATSFFYFFGWAYTGRSGTTTGSPKLFRVLARYEGDRIIQFEQDVAHYLFNAMWEDPDKTLFAWSEERKRRRGPLLEAPKVIQVPGAAVLKQALFLPDGRMFAVDGQGALWEREPGADRSSLRMPGSPIVPDFANAGPLPLAADPSGRFVVLGARNRLRIWDTLSQSVALDQGEVELGPERRSFWGLHGLAFSPNGRWLAALDWASPVLLEVGSWKPTAWLEWAGAVDQAAFSPDNRQLVVRGERLRILDSTTGRKLADFFPDTFSGPFSMQGSRLVLTTPGIMMVDLELLRDLGPFTNPPARTPHPPALGLAGPDLLWIYWRETFEQWRLTELEQHLAFERQNPEPKEVPTLPAPLKVAMIPITADDLWPFYRSERSISPDGRWLLNHWHPYLQILSTTNLKPLGAIKMPERREDIRIGWAPDGKLFLMAPTEVRVYDLAAFQASQASGPVKAR